MADYTKFIRSTVNVFFTNDEIKLYEDEVSRIFWGPEPLVNGYRWKDFIYDNPDMNDADWNNFYAQIYISNVVLDKIEEASGTNEDLRKMTKGEALAQRAYAYFMLVNIYGKHYNSATSLTDLGVPLYLDSDINKLKGRATVEEVYNQIESRFTRGTSVITRNSRVPLSSFSGGSPWPISKVVFI